MSQAYLTMEAQTTDLTIGPAFSFPTKKLAIWLFIIADTMTFAACLVAYGFLRNGTPDWPRPFHSITNVALMTFILLSSSLTMLIGLRSAKAGDKAGAFRWTMITAALGIVFALLHVREWLALNLKRAFAARSKNIGAPSVPGVQAQLKRWRRVLKRD